MKRSTTIRTLTATALLTASLTAAAPATATETASARGPLVPDFATSTALGPMTHDVLANDGVGTPGGYRLVGVTLGTGESHTPETVTWTRDGKITVDLGAKADGVIRDTYVRYTAASTLTGQQWSSTASFWQQVEVAEVTPTPAPGKPKARVDHVTIRVGEEKTVDVLANDDAGAGTPVVRYLSGPPAPGIGYGWSTQDTGRISIDVGKQYKGPKRFRVRYVLIDEKRRTSVSTVRVTVKPTPKATRAPLKPKARPDRVTIRAGSEKSVDVLKNDRPGAGTPVVRYLDDFPSRIVYGWDSDAPGRLYIHVGKRYQGPKRFRVRYVLIDEKRRTSVSTVRVTVKRPKNAGIVKRANAAAKTHVKASASQRAVAPQVVGDVTPDGLKSAVEEEASDEPEPVATESASALYDPLRREWVPVQTEPTASEPAAAVEDSRLWLSWALTGGLLTFAAIAGVMTARRR